MLLFLLFAQQKYNFGVNPQGEAPIFLEILVGQ